MPLPTVPNRHNATHPPSRPSDPTIYALSTAPGRAAIAIIRLSGPLCLSLYASLCPRTPLPKPRFATLRTLFDPVEPSAVLDPGALVLYFPAPRTVTGEDVLELHVHGGRAVVQAVLAGIAAAGKGLEGGGVRYAEPGEFTRRGFQNGRLDLTQAEALGDVLDAATEQQRALSVRGTGGTLAQVYEGWRGNLLEARGELEALIDFSEDQHFDEDVATQLGSVAGQVRALKRALEAQRANAVRGELVRGGIGLVLLGAPNAGKSSLLNLVVGREAAIVSAEAGTTRDVVEVGVDVGGFLVRVGDTAGLRSGRVGVVEEEGMRRARARADESDVVLVVLGLGKDGRVGLDAEVVQTAARLVREKDNVLVALNKTDVVTSPAQLQTAIDDTVTALPGLSRDRILPISCKTAESPPASTATSDSDPGAILALLHALKAHFTRLTTPDPSESDFGPSLHQESLGATERHRLLLSSCLSHLDDFTALVESADDEEGGDGEADVVVAAEYLRGAAEALARITGRGDGGDVEEVLGVVFEKFCVGK